MPTVFDINGYRFFFYSNENNEPMHIHISKGGAEAKYWIIPNLEEVILMVSNSRKGRK